MLSREIQAWYDSRGFEKQRHRMQHRGVQAWDNKRRGTAWHCGPHGYKQFTNGQLKKYSLGVGQKKDLGITDRVILYNTCKRHHIVNSDVTWNCRIMCKELGVKVY